MFRVNTPKRACETHEFGLPRAVGGNGVGEYSSRLYGVFFVGMRMSII